MLNISKTRAKNALARAKTLRKNLREERDNLPSFFGGAGVLTAHSLESAYEELVNLDQESISLMQYVEVKADSPKSVQPRDIGRTFEILTWKGKTFDVTAAVATGSKMEWSFAEHSVFADEAFSPEGVDGVIPIKNISDLPSPADRMPCCGRSLRM